MIIALFAISGESYDVQRYDFLSSSQASFDVRGDLSSLRYLVL